MIKNINILTREIRPDNPDQFRKFLENKIRLVLEHRNIVGLLPYNSTTCYGDLSIKSENEITIKNIEVEYI